MVLEQDTTGNWVERNTPTEIFLALTSEYHKKYHQTKSTPPMRTPMVNMLGFLGTNRRSNQVLEGNYETVPGLQSYSKRLLTKLKRIDNYEDIPVGISRKEYQEGWKKARENKSSGGKVIHFGHCKCMARDNHLSEMEDRKSVV